MMHSANNFRRGFAMLLLMVGVLTAAAGDRIIFSTSDREEIAPPTPDNPRAPEVKEQLRLSLTPAAPQPVMPYVPPSPARPDPRKKTERRTLFDEPELFADPFGRKKPESSPMDGSAPGRSMTPRRFQIPDLGREEERALSPVKQYDWAPEETEEKKASASGTREQRLPFETSLFSARRDEALSATERSAAGFLDHLSARDMARDRLERQAEFEKMLSSTPHPALRGTERGTSPLMSPLDTPRSPATFVAPPIPDAAPRLSLDPLQAFNEQQQRLRAPSVDDLNRKALGSAETKRSSSGEKANQRPSLMRQPTFQDFPSRGF
jgi:hypothetical protein